MAGLLTRPGHRAFPVLHQWQKFDDFLMDPVDSGTSQTRAVTNSDGTLTITFDDFDPGMLAGPTSAGENLYSYQGYPQKVIVRATAREQGGCGK